MVIAHLEIVFLPSNFVIAEVYSVDVAEKVPCQYRSGGDEEI
jgi:hypothetical protein